MIGAENSFFFHQTRTRQDIQALAAACSRLRSDKKFARIRRHYQQVWADAAISLFAAARNSIKDRIASVNFYQALCKNFESTNT